jgi:class 3 adenylate cyclase
VVDRAGDLFGTAVNIAARLEGITQPGGIVVSAAVRDAIAGKLALPFTDMGLQALKNIHLWADRFDGALDDIFDLRSISLRTW